jgi:hypothetical protein
MNNTIIKNLLLDDYYLYNELKKLAKEIKLEEGIDFESALHLAVEQFSIYILQSKETIIYRYYKYDEQINS